MKSAIKQLTPNDREALVHFYDTNDYKVLKKLIEIQKTELAKAHVGQLDIQQIRYLTGQVASFNWLTGTIQDNFQEVTNPKKS